MRPFVAAGRRRVLARVPAAQLKGHAGVLIVVSDVPRVVLTVGTALNDRRERLPDGLR